MYLTRLKIDPLNRNTMRALAEPKYFHGAIERGLAGERRQRSLWRIDRLEEAYYLLLVSAERPDLSAAARQFGFPSAVPLWETRDYEPHLRRIQDESRWHFRLTANPTKHLSGDPGSKIRGRVAAHATAKHQQQWLMDKAPQYGFTLNADEFLAVSEQWHRFQKPAEGSRPVSFLSVTFEGTLTVTDAELFRNTLTQGIGRAKAYGMGLLTVVRIGDRHE